VRALLTTVGQPITSRTGQNAAKRRNIRKASSIIRAKVTVENS
jgi:hypothetical protein